jgi:hypothetical protein
MSKCFYLENCVHASGGSLDCVDDILVHLPFSFIFRFETISFLSCLILATFKSSFFNNVVEAYLLVH